MKRHTYVALSTLYGHVDPSKCLISRGGYKDSLRSVTGEGGNSDIFALHNI